MMCRKDLLPTLILCSSESRKIDFNVLAKIIFHDLFFISTILYKIYVFNDLLFSVKLVCNFIPNITSFSKKG